MSINEEDSIEDFLSVDDKIPGQNYVCLSFVSPEKIIKKRETYIIHKFLKEHVEEFKLDEKEIVEKYENFCYKHEKDLNEKFNEENDFTTSVRGLKIRGVYESKREADVRAKVLQQKDRIHNVFVAQIGYWLPWDPTLSYLDDVDAEYMDRDLNTLMKKYNENQQNKDMYYQEMLADKINADNNKNTMDKDDPWIQKTKTTVEEDTPKVETEDAPEVEEDNENILLENEIKEV